MNPRPGEVSDTESFSCRVCLPDKTFSRYRAAVGACIVLLHASLSSGCGSGGSASGASLTVPTYYNVVDLDAARSGTRRGVRLNDQGLVAAVMMFGQPNSHAVLCSSGGTNDLGAIHDAEDSGAYDVNFAGTAVGFSSPLNSYRHAAVWTNGQRIDLGTLGVPGTSEARAVNDAGDVVGSAASGNFWHAFLWRTGRMQDLGTLGPAGSSYAYDINNQGQIVGEAPAANTLHAFIWQAGEMRDLTPSTAQPSRAVTINSFGHVAGIIDDRTPSRAVIWRGGVTETIDPSTGGLSNLEPRGINDADMVVGIANTASASTGFLFAAGRLHDVNTMLPPGSPWRVQFANDINNRGQIIVQAQDPQGIEHALLLTPAP